MVQVRTMDALVLVVFQKTAMLPVKYNYFYLYIRSIGYTNSGPATIFVISQQSAPIIPDTVDIFLDQSYRLLISDSLLVLAPYCMLIMTWSQVNGVSSVSLHSASTAMKLLRPEYCVRLDFRLANGDGLHRTPPSVQSSSVSSSLMRS
jgi:hypothetical protein